MARSFVAADERLYDGKPSSRQPLEWGHFLCKTPFPVPGVVAIQLRHRFSQWFVAGEEAVGAAREFETRGFGPSEN